MEARNPWESAMPSTQVLVVEDDETLAHAVTRNLQVRGIDVARAGTVADAVDSIRTHVPAVLLLDIDLPDGSGWDVLRAMQPGQIEPMAVIVMSALRPNSRLCNEFHCTAILEKPFPMGSLMRLIMERVKAGAAQGSLEL
jgi:DNA-binding response OmpR family regulator